MTSQERRRRIARRAAIAVACLIIMGAVSSWLVAGALISPNLHQIGDPPDDLAASAFQVPSESGAMISGWHTRASAANGVVVLLHGIWGSRLSMLERAELLHSAGYSTVLIDFQGHGESTGDVITIGHRERHDVRAAVEFARREHPGERIGVVGVSLGGASALLASPLNIDALVLESVFPDIESAVRNRVASRLGPFASIPTSLLLVQLQPRLGVDPSELRPIDHIAEIDCPVLIASGTDDLHTTKSETRAMYSAARQPKQLWLVEDAGHVDLMRFDPPEYRQRILGFLDHQIAAPR